MESRRDRDPLAPIETVVKLLLAVLVGVLVAVGGVIAWQLATTGTTQAGLGSFSDGEVCLQDVSDVPVRGVGDGPSGTEIPDFDDDRGDYVPRGWEVCASEASVGQKAVVALGDALGIGGIVLSLSLLLWAVRGARRSGLFTEVSAGRTRVLGWTLLLLALVRPVVATIGQGWVLSSLIADYAWWRPLGGLTFSSEFSVVTIVVAIGIITFSRILERAVPLQEEVDATV